MATTRSLQWVLLLQALFVVLVLGCRLVVAQQTRVLFLDGTTSHVELPQLTFGGTDTSIEAWVLVRSASAEHAPIVALGTDIYGSDRFFFGLANDKLALRVKNTPAGIGSGDVVDNTALPLGVWVHVAAVQQAGQASLYLNGMLRRQGAMPQVVSLQRSVGTLGKPLLLLSKYFNGLLDNVRLWNVARTGVQLQGSMHASLGAGVAGLLFSYDFEHVGGPDGAEIADSSAAERNATLVCNVDACLFEVPLADRIICGDGTRGPTEACDDGNAAGGDGCSANCDLIEPGYVCHAGSPAGTDTCLLGQDLLVDGFESNDPSAWFHATGAAGSWETGSEYRFFGEYGLKLSQAGFGPSITAPSATDRVLWLRPDELQETLLDGDSVSEWPDASGFNHSASILGGLRTLTAPKLRTNVLNGWAAVEFNGGTNGLTIDRDLKLTKPFSIFIVNRYTENRGGRLLQGVTQNWLLGMYNYRNAFYSCGWVKFPSGRTYRQPRGDWSLNAGIGDTSTTSHFIDGNLVGATSALCDPMDLGFSNGGRYTQVSYAQAVEVLAYNRAMSDEERQQVEAYLEAKYFQRGAAQMALLQRLFANNAADYVTWGEQTLGAIDADTLVSFAYNIRAAPDIYGTPLIVVFQDSTVVAPPFDCALETDCTDRTFISLCFNAGGAPMHCDETLSVAEGSWQQHSVDLVGLFNRKYGTGISRLNATFSGIPSSIKVQIGCIAGAQACETWVDQLQVVKLSDEPSCDPVFASVTNVVDYERTALDARPVALLLLDETSGTQAADAVSGAAGMGQYSATGITLGQPPLITSLQYPEGVTPPPSFAVMFSGGGAVTVAAPDRRWAPNSGTTYEFFVAFQELPLGPVALVGDVAGIGDYFVRLEAVAGGKLSASVLTTVGELTVETPAVFTAVDTSYHVAASFSGYDGRFRIAVNGASQTLTGVARPVNVTVDINDGEPLVTTNAVILGANAYYPSANVSFWLDAFAVYARNLPDQVAGHHSQFATKAGGEGVWWAPLAAIGTTPVLQRGNTAVLPSQVPSGVVVVARLDAATEAVLGWQQFDLVSSMDAHAAFVDYIKAIPDGDLVVAAYQALPDSHGDVVYDDKEQELWYTRRENYEIQTRYAHQGTYATVAWNNMGKDPSYEEARLKCVSIGGRLCEYDDMCIRQGIQPKGGRVSGVGLVALASNHSWVYAGSVYTKNYCKEYHEVHSVPAPDRPVQGTAYQRCCRRTLEGGNWEQVMQAHNASTIGYFPGRWYNSWNRLYQSTWIYGTDHPTSTSWWTVRCHSQYQRGVFAKWVDTNALWADFVWELEFYSHIRGVGFMFRYVDENNFYRFYMMNENRQQYSCAHILRVRNGVYTYLRTADNVLTYVRYEWTPLRIEALGPSIKVYVNNELYMTAWDDSADAITAGSIGYYTYFSYSLFRNGKVTLATNQTASLATTVNAAFDDIGIVNSRAVAQSPDQSWAMMAVKGDTASAQLQGGPMAGISSVTSMFNCRTQSRSVPENAPLDSLVMVPVRGRRQGTPSNFQIEAGNVGGAFGVNPSSGVLAVAGVINYEDLVDPGTGEATYSLRVAAGTPRFDSGWFVMRSDDPSQSYRDVVHNMNVEPSQLVVHAYIRVLDGVNKGMIFAAEGAAAMSDNGLESMRYGGMVAATDSSTVRLWAPSFLELGGGSIVYAEHGWGASVDDDGDYIGELHASFSHAAEVRVVVEESVVPDFDTGWFQAASQTQVSTLREVWHNFGDYPDEVRVYVRPASGPNAGYVFRGVSQPMNIDNYNDYGGVVYGYGKASVRLWLPDRNNNRYTGWACHVAEGWGGEVNTCEEHQVDIRVVAWQRKYDADYDSGWLRFTKGGRSFEELTHGLGAAPERVAVWVQSSYSSNVDMLFDGSGMAKTNTWAYWTQYGGIVNAFNDDTIRLWAPSKWPFDGSSAGSGARPLSIYDGWGAEGWRELSNYANVRVRAWRKSWHVRDVANVTVNVTDVAEPPRTSDVDLRIDEDMPRDTLVAQVQAVDEDADSDLSFSIVAGNVGDAFWVSPTNGSLYILNSEAVDHEKRRNFALAVRVSDGKFAATSSVRFSIRNINDPVVVDSATMYVDEEVPRNTLVGSPLNASDSDPDQTLIFSIFGGNIDGAFKIGACNGQLRVANATLNYEDPMVGGVYNLIVKVEDDGFPPSSAFAAIDIVLRDVNDPPVFTQLQVQRSVNENSPVGAAVGAPLPVVDEDAGAVLSYVIELGDSEGFFNVSADGQMRVARAGLDFEKVNPITGQPDNVFRLRVVVYDNHVPPLFDKGLVTIQVTDVNDPPVITSGSRYVEELAGDGALVGTPLTVSDQDDGDSVTWSLAAPSSTFDLAPNGQISVKSGVVLDFESVNEYWLVVNATDSGGGPGIRGLYSRLSTVRNITIFLENVNEAPVLNTATYSVPENSPAGYVVGSLDVEDVDGDELLFTILGGNTGNAFSVNDATREVVVAQAVLDFETTPSYSVQILVEDRDELEDFENVGLNDTNVITINVLDVNDPPRVECDASNPYEWVEHPEFNAVFGRILVPIVDADGVNTFYYGDFDTVAECRDACAADPACAAFAMFLPSYARVNWQRTCHGRSSRWDTMENEYDAGVVSGEKVHVCQVLTVDENVPVGTQVNPGGLTFSDDDGNTVSFTLDSGNVDGTFALAPATGLITVANAVLNHENITRYFLAVTGIDDHVPPANETILLAVLVANVNEPPSIEDASLSVLELDPAGYQLVPPVTHSDVDAADSLTLGVVSEEALATGGSTCLHSTSGGDTFFFTFTQSTGALTLAREMTLNAPCTLAVNMSVTDGLLTDYATATIVVEDQNKRPEIQDVNLTRVIPENSPAGTTVTPNLVLYDANPTDTVTVRLESVTPSDGGPMPFSVTKQPSGEAEIMLTRSILNHEVVSEYRLLVVAQDDGDGQLTTSAVVVITVGDLPEAPQVPATMVLAVAENSPPGTVALEAAFYDDDDDVLNFTLLPQGNEEGFFDAVRKPGANQVVQLVVVKDGLDYEAGTRSFQLHMNTTDGVYEFATTIDVTVVDVREAPIFNPTNFSVVENSPPGTLVGVLTATDPDGDPMFFYAEAGNFAGVFEVDKVSGNVTIADYDTTGTVVGGGLGVDYENYRSYKLTIQVQDREIKDSSTALSGVGDVIITVINVDDMSINSFEQFSALSTAGQQTVRIRGHDMYSRRHVPDSIVATYGPTGVEYTATGCVIDRDPQSAFPNNTLVTCQSAPGVGRDHVWSLTIDDQSAVSSATTRYREPAVTGLRLAVGGGAVLLGTAGGEKVRITGTNFGPGAAGTTITAQYGQYPATGCVVTVAHTELECTSVAGVGFNHTWVVTVATQPSSVTQWPLVSSYLPPSISSLGGATAMSTQGSEVVLVRGTNLGPAQAAVGSGGSGASTATPDADAEYGRGGVVEYGTTCVVTQDNVELSCTTAPGVGANHAWRVVVGGQTSEWSAATTSYLPPVVFAVGGEGAFGGSTQGGERVIVSGDQFGPAGDASITSITYGPAGLRYSAQNCSVTQAHRTIECVTAPGTGKDHSWFVTMDGQRSVNFPANSSYGPPFVTHFSGAAYPFADTQGSQWLDVGGVNFGNDLALISNIRYGPRAYEPTDCTLVEAHVLLRCKTVAGAGGGLEWSLVVDDQPTASPVSRYAPPEVWSLRLYAPGAAVPGYDGQPNSVTGASTDGGETLVIDGTNFAAAESGFLEGVTYGPRGDPARYRATACYVALNHTQVRCTTARGVGSNMVVVVRVRGQNSLDNVLSLSYAPPVITALVPNHGGTQGGYTMTVRGTNFGSASNPAVTLTSSDHTYVWYGAQFDTVRVDGPQDELVLTVPEDEGRAWSVYVSVLADDPEALAASFSSALFTATRSNLRTWNYDDPFIQRIVTQDGGVVNVTRLTIHGSNFGLQSNSRVELSGGVVADADIDEWSHSQIVLNTTLSEGVVFVYVGGQQRQSNNKTFAFLSPVINTIEWPSSGPGHTNVAPTEGGKAAGIQMRLVGLYFGREDEPEETTVTIGDAECEDMTLSIAPNPVDPAKPIGTILCYAPPGQGADLDLYVNRNQQASVRHSYTYDPPVVSSISPSTPWPTDGKAPPTPSPSPSGRRLAAASGVMLGQDFGLNATVWFDDLAIAPYLQTHARLEFWLPPMRKGWVGLGHTMRVEVGNQDYTSAQTINYAAPTLTSVTPSQSSTTGGGSITIAGQNLGLEGAVTLAGTALVCNNVTWSHTSIECTVPEGVGRDLAIAVTVGGQASTNTLSFSYTAPSVATVSPTSGATKGGTTVTLQGSNFGTLALGGAVSWCLRRQCITVGTSTGGQEVTCSAVACTSVGDFSPITGASVLSYSHDTIEVASPQGQGTAMVRVAVGGQSTIAGTSFTYNTPVLANLTADHGPTDACFVWESFSRFIQRTTAGGASGADATRRCCKPLTLTLRGEDLGFEDLAIQFDTGAATVEEITQPCGYVAPVQNGCSNPVACIEAHTHDKVVFRAPAGFGAKRSAAVTVATVAAPAALAFGYDPPEVLYIQSTPFDGAGDSLVVTGRNFGNSDNDVSVFLGQEECAEATWQVDERGIENNGRPYVTCKVPPVLVGFHNITITAANQTTHISHWAELAESICTLDYYGQVGELCLPCPRGAICKGAYAEPYSEPAWWKLNITAEDARCVEGRRHRAQCPLFVPCEPKLACLGSNTCSTGYTGIRCKDCVRGTHYRVAGECVECPKNAWLIAIFFFVGAIAACLAGYVLNRKNVNMSVVTIGVDYFQVLALFARSKVTWPESLRAFFRIMSIFNINLEITAPECSIPDLGYDTKWFATQALPIAALALFGVFHVLVWFKKRCIMGRRKRLHSHGSALVGTALIMFYFLYLLLTRFTLDVFNCNPTDPPDGFTYLEVVFEPCWQAGGLQLRLFPWALLSLALYSFGFPGYVFWRLYKGRELAKEDQFLRAMNAGWTRADNPNSYDFRKRYHKLYYHFKPKYYFWLLIIIARKFGIAFTSLMFRRNPGFQLAMALLVMFFAYAAQVKYAPFMSVSDREGVLEYNDRMAAEGSRLHSKIASTLRGVKRQQMRKRMRKWNDPRDDEKPTTKKKEVGDIMFNLNSVEATLLFSAVLVNLAGLMFQSGKFATDDQKVQRELVTVMVVLVIVCSILYWTLVFVSEVLGKKPPCLRTRMEKIDAKAKKQQGKGAAGKKGAMDDGAAQLDVVTNPMRMAGGGKGKASAPSEATSGVNYNPMMEKTMSENDITGESLSLLPPDDVSWVLISRKFGRLESEVQSMAREMRSLQMQRRKQKAAGTRRAARGGGRAGAGAGAGSRTATAPSKS